ncbi:MAG: hypothetical protein AAB853_00695 [Patescibacteria group bacterium]
MSVEKDKDRESDLPSDLPGGGHRPEEQQSQIRDLIEENLAGKKVDIVGTVDQLLGIAVQEGELRGDLASDRCVRFRSSSNHPLFEVEAEHAKGKLQAMCARLATMCNQQHQDVNLYGGEAYLMYNGKRFHLRFMNTPGEQWFSLTTSTHPESTSLSFLVSNP